MDKKENSAQKRIKPKQYTHIDYVAILIQAMQKGCSISECITRNGLDIARSTVTRNIRKIKEDENTSKDDRYIIDLYEKEYVPNQQKKPLPIGLHQKIEDLPKRPIVTKTELEDLLKKLNIMNTILEQAKGNYAEAARIISSGTTLLGNVRISNAGLEKNIRHYKEIQKELEEERSKDDNNGR